VSDWRPAASAGVLKLRAKLFHEARRFFAERDVLEVDTPALGVSTAFDVHISSLETRLSGAGPGRFYLQTSPESFMKRLLAAGSGSIYQFARSFRNGEVGRLHNPEFVMLEWYRVGIDLPELMDEVESLASRLLGGGAPAVRLSYRQAFERFVGMDPFTASAEDIAETCHQLGLGGPARDRTEGLDLILSRRVQTAISPRRTFLYDFPPEQAAMAKVRREQPPVASRFEYFIEGVEIANGYDELDDAGEQARRMAANAETRRRTGLPVPPVDQRLLDALEHGLPPCCGVALGFDRVVMLAAGKDDVRAVMPFPVDRC